MRNQGYTRLLSIFIIRSEIRSKYARMSKQKMLRMLTPICELTVALYYVFRLSFIMLYHTPWCVIQHYKTHTHHTSHITHHKMHEHHMNSYFLFSVTPRGQFVAQEQNPAVCEKLLTEISQWLCQDPDIEWSDIISRLHPRTVPNGYTYNPWRIGKCFRTSHKSE